MRLRNVWSWPLIHRELTLDSQGKIVHYLKLKPLATQLTNKQCKCTLNFARNLIVFPSLISGGFFPGNKRKGKATPGQAAKRHKKTPLTTVNTKRGARPTKDTHTPLIQQCIEAKPSDSVWCVLFKVHLILINLIIYRAIFQGVRSQCQN